MSGAAGVRTPSSAPPKFSTPEDEAPGSYAGWYIGTITIVVILAIGMALWFTYHP